VVFLFIAEATLLHRSSTLGAIAAPAKHYYCMSDDVLHAVVLTFAVACRRARYHGLPGSDALIWPDYRARFTCYP